MLSAKEKALVLSVHDEKFSPHDIFLNPDSFPRATSGEIFEVSSADRKIKLVLQYFPIAPVKVNIQVSVAKALAAAFNLAARSEVVVEPLSAAAAAVDFVEVSFKDQYIGRSDMWRLRGSLHNTCLYTGKKMVFSCIRAQVSSMYRGGQQVSSGLVTENTKFIFRSKTAKIYLLIQMSREMWEFAEDGDLYFEKAMDNFLKELFDRWAAGGTNHSVAIVFFSRSYFLASCSESDLNTDQVTGRKYRDYYRVICNERRSDWSTALFDIKREFNEYPKHIGWDPFKPTGGGGENSSAREGNLLEAVNLSLLVFDRHHIDRDLTRTGQLNVVITPGVGLYDVDSALSRMTKHKMMESGIGCDLICLTRPPLHVVPLFRFKDQQYSYAQPHWIHVSYLPQKPGSSGYSGGPAPFEPRCRMPEAQLSYIDVMAMDPDPPVIPFEPRDPKGSSAVVLPRRNTSVSQFSSYDQSVFSSLASRSPRQVFAPRSPRGSASGVEDVAAHGVGNNSLKVSSFTDRYRSSSGDALASMDRAGSKSISIESGRLRKVKSVDASGADPASLEMLSPISPSDLASESGPESYGQSPDRRMLRSSSKKSLNTSQIRPAFNPFNLGQEPKENSTFRKRWVHVFHSGVTQYVNKPPFVPNWKSLCEPASLPLTTDYFPTESELKSLYTEGVYSLSLTSSDNVNAYSIEDCLREMVSQRLAQGFQLILGMDEGQQPQAAPSASQGQARKTAKVFYLSFGRVYHKLSVDLASQNIDIKRYTRRDTQQPHKHKPYPLPYTFNVWPLLHSDRRVVAKRVLLRHQSADIYPWNYLDRIICGYESQFTDAIRYWRVRFGLVPSAALMRSHKLFLRQTSFGKEVEDKQEPEMSELDKINNFLKFKSQLLSQGVRGKLAPSTVSKLDMAVYVQSTLPADVLSAAGANLRETPPARPSKLDRSLRLDIEPSKTDRPEFLEIKYDSVFVPGSVYHLELDWIICTGCVVDDFISNMRRKAENSGLSLVQLPIDQVSNPFLSHVTVPLLDDFVWMLRDPAAIEAVLSKFDFSTEMATFAGTSSSHYMHKSGMAFLLPSADDRGFLWYTNFLASVTRFVPATLVLLADFTAFCGSRDKLQEFAAALRATQSVAAPAAPAGFDEQAVGSLQANGDQVSAATDGVLESAAVSGFTDLTKDATT